MNKILLLAPQDVSGTIRLKEAALKNGISLDVLSINELFFVASDSGAVGTATGLKSGVFHKGVDLISKYDVLVVRDFHPHISEALTVARLFADAGKRVIDASLTDEGYSVSKMHDYLRLALAGLPVPKTWQVYDLAQLADLASKLGFPVVLKGDHGSQGEHVYKVLDSSELSAQFKKYPPGQLLLQEYLVAEGDYRVITVGYKALSKIVFRRPVMGDFRTNTSPDWESLDTKDYPDLREIAEKASRILRREFAATDIRYCGSKPLILEVNRRPGFDSFERATDLNVAEVFVRYAAVTPSQPQL